MIAALNLSPASLIDVLQTMPLRESTAMSLVPPPMSRMRLPFGREMSIPAPIAAATGVSKEASVVVSADGPLHQLSDLGDTLTVASTDAPDVERICRILLEPANIGPGDLELQVKPNPVLVAKAVMRDEVQVGFFPQDAYDELSSMVKDQLRVLISSHIFVVRNSLLASPAIADQVDAIWAGLETMNHDAGDAELLHALGAPNGWERLTLEDTHFMIDLMDALSQG